MFVTLIYLPNIWHSWYVRLNNSFIFFSFFFQHFFWIFSKIRSMITKIWLTIVLIITLITDLDVFFLFDLISHCKFVARTLWILWCTFFSSIVLKTNDLTYFISLYHLWVIYHATRRWVRPKVAQVTIIITNLESTFITEIQKQKHLDSELIFDVSRFLVKFMEL